MNNRLLIKLKLNFQIYVKRFRLQKYKLSSITFDVFETYF